jgi:hypothetical protein
MENRRIKTTSSELRDYDERGINDFDLIVIGSPVFYYDTPSHVKAWIKSLPDLKGTSVASYVTFGGPEENQHNAACSILECLTENKGVPIAMKARSHSHKLPQISRKGFE